MLIAIRVATRPRPTNNMLETNRTRTGRRSHRSILLSSMILPKSATNASSRADFPANIPSSPPLSPSSSKPMSAATAAVVTSSRDRARVNVKHFHIAFYIPAPAFCGCGRCSPPLPRPIFFFDITHIVHIHLLFTRRTCELFITYMWNDTLHTE